MAQALERVVVGDKTLQRFIDRVVGVVNPALKDLSTVQAACEFSAASMAWAGNAAPKVYKSGKVVRIDGIVQVRTALTRYVTSILGIPVGFRPLRTIDALVGSSPGLVEIGLSTDGRVLISDNGTVPSVGHYVKIYATYLAE